MFFFLCVGKLSFCSLIIYYVSISFTMSRVGFRSYDSQIRLTRSYLPIFNIYLKFKKYIINILFTFLSNFLNKTQILSSPCIVCVDLVLCSELLGYNFALICGNIVPLLNLLLIIVIKFLKKCPTRSTWSWLSWTSMTG